MHEVILEPQPAQDSQFGHSIPLPRGALAHDVGALHRQLERQLRGMDDPDLILLDIDLPDPSGIRVLGRLDRRGTSMATVAAYSATVAQAQASALAA